MRTHKVGTVTLGVTLVTFGILLMARIFVKTLSYQLIFKFWPVIFIILGCEVLFSCFRKQEEKLQYDGGAVVLMVLLSLFAMCMAGAEFLIQYANYHITMY